ncbi:hypothetical protein B2M26_10825 [Ferroacidibacillus organovorans]|uniref:serine-type D-Ala-D-Ala carboxypeptidase n=1 Tax=Ferroacidibacillus organovorans TaxID=1765683 RepID=A0A1V4ERR2_9BACL|nr:hypothetical protein B2M26_10825 [Ferroacidibacillus organovorans]
MWEVIGLGKVRQTIAIALSVVIVAAGSIVALAETGKPQNSTQGSSTLITNTDNYRVSQVPLAAPSAELIDATTGQILYAKQAATMRYPASIVKLMTSLIALEQVKKGQLTLHSIIPVSQAAYKVAQTPGLSVAYLDPSQRVSLQRMLELMYVVSADDAAVAVADAIGGSESAFAQMMNREAAKLHMTHTHYTNASGLQNSKQVTTAHDIGILTRYLITKYPVVLTYASMPGMDISPGNYGHTYDQLLGQYQGLNGLKTGSTSQAGYCFVGTAVRNGHHLISIVLGDSSFPNVFQDTAALLDFGFQNFHRLSLNAENTPLAQMVTVSGGANQTLPVVTHQPITALAMHHDKVSMQLSTLTQKAPIAKGQQVGDALVIVNRTVVSKVPVYAAQNDPKASFLTEAWRNLMRSAHQGSRKIVDAVVHKVQHLIG